MIFLLKKCFLSDKGPISYSYRLFGVKMSVAWDVAFTMWVWFGVWLPAPDLGFEKLAIAI